MSSRSMLEIASRTFAPGAVPITDGARVTSGRQSNRTRSSRITLAVASLMASCCNQRSIQ